MPSSHLILRRPLLLLPPTPPSIRVFSNESTLCMRWQKYWSFSCNIIPSKEIPGLISFRMDWLDLLTVQGTLKSLLQHHSSKASILWRSAYRLPNKMFSFFTDLWSTNCDNHCSNIPHSVADTMYIVMWKWTYSIKMMKHLPCVQHFPRVGEYNENTPLDAQLVGTFFRKSLLHFHQ